VIRGRAAALALTPALALSPVLVGACQTGDGAAGGSAGPPTAGPTAEVVATLGPPPSPTAHDQPSAVSLDPTVLGVLPASIGGVPVAESVDDATQALADPSLPRIATSMDAGVAADPASGNLVYAWVVRLRPGKLTDEIYRQWRDSYDEGACSGAGGVTGHAEARIDDRTVYITSCARQLRAYHLWLERQGILISASATGDARFGEQLMDNLRVPA